MRVYIYATHIRKTIIIIMHFLAAALYPCSWLRLPGFTRLYKTNFHLLWFPYANRYRAQ